MPWHERRGGYATSVFRKNFSGVFAALRASLQKHFERNFTFTSKIAYVFGVKIRAAIQPYKFAAKHINFLVIVDGGFVPLDFRYVHHDFSQVNF